MALHAARFTPTQNGENECTSSAACSSDSSSGEAREHVNFTGGQGSQDQAPGNEMLEV